MDGMGPIVLSNDRCLDPEVSNTDPHNQWLFLVPLKGGIGGIVHPPIGRKNATYILPSVGLCATYHLLGEPETTIDTRYDWRILED